MTSEAKRILVIEDDQQVRKLFQVKLSRLGYVVDEASDGNEGLSSCQKNRYDLVITDLVMPEKEGIETIIELKKDYSDIKIIAISGGGRLDPSNYLNIAKKLGANRVFTKPVEWDQMIEAVEKLTSEA
ncbi:MAG: response regulator [Desulfobulbaceae bacterium]|nr:MAG: response regulator [Desulfobulbaceae bacterium]